MFTSYASKNALKIYTMPCWDGINRAINVIVLRFIHDNDDGDEAWVVANYSRCCQIHTQEFWKQKVMQHKQHIGLSV